MPQKAATQGQPESPSAEPKKGFWKKVGKLIKKDHKDSSAPSTPTKPTTPVQNAPPHSSPAPTPNVAPVATPQQHSMDATPGAPTPPAVKTVQLPSITTVEAEPQPFTDLAAIVEDSKPSEISTPVAPPSTPMSPPAAATAAVLVEAQPQQVISNEAQAPAPATIEDSTDHLVEAIIETTPPAPETETPYTTLDAPITAEMIPEEINHAETAAQAQPVVPVEAEPKPAPEVARPPAHATLPHKAQRNKAGLVTAPEAPSRLPKPRPTTTARTNSTKARALGATGDSEKFMAAAVSTRPMRLSTPGSNGAKPVALRTVGSAELDVAELSKHPEVKRVRMELENARLQRLVMQLEAQLKHEREDRDPMFEKEITRLKTRIRTLEMNLRSEEAKNGAKIQQLGADAEKAAADAAAAAAETARCEAEIARLKERVCVLEGELRESRAAHADAEKRVADRDAELASTQQKLQKVTKQAADLEAELTEAESQGRSSKESVQDLLATLKTRNAELEATEKLLNEARMKMEDSVRETEAAKLEVAAAKEQLEGAWKMAEQETHRAQQLETQVFKLNCKISSINGEGEEKAKGKAGKAGKGPKGGRQGSIRVANPEEAEAEPVSEPVTPTTDQMAVASC